MEMRKTKLGLMFNVKTPCNKDNPHSYLWIRESDIIGMQTWIEKYYTHNTPTYCYGIRVAFTVGKGINGTDSTIQVTRDTYNAIAEHFDLPTMP